MKIKNKLLSLGFFLFLAGMGTWLLAKEPEDYSDSERRVLKQKSAFTIERIENGKYMSDFENVLLDQFPARDSFRRVKAELEQYIWHKKDNNNIYYADGYLSKMDYPLNEKRVDIACEQVNEIYDKYLKEKGIQPYLAVIPDKNYYLAEQTGHLTLDYEKLYAKVYESLDQMAIIEVKDLLSLEDYYYTDTHWRQECIADVAGRIIQEMKNGAVEELNETPENYNSLYEIKTLEAPFYGVYAGQAALNVKPDVLTVLTNETLSNCRVTSFDSGKPEETVMYDWSKASGKDPYELFLNGAAAILTIDNPAGDRERELIIFRDSFGSSLAPLLVENYGKITLIDLRYIQSDLIGDYVDFEDQDVLFLYSTLMINNGLGK